MKVGSLRAFSYEVKTDECVIGVDEAQTWIDQNAPLILDVRGNLAYKMSTLSGAINIPWELLETMIDAADPFPKDRPILLICPVGEKTIRHAAYLRSRGYEAFSLAGGILGWRNAGKPLVKSGESASAKTAGIKAQQLVEAR